VFFVPGSPISEQRGQGQDGQADLLGKTKTAFLGKEASWTSTIISGKRLPNRKFLGEAGCLILTLLKFQVVANFKFYLDPKLFS